MALSLGLFFVRGLNYGVDFKGGSLIEVQSKSGPADLGAIRDKLGGLGLGDVQIQSFGGDTDVLIRVEQQPGGDAEQQAAMTQGHRRAGRRLHAAARGGRRPRGLERAAHHRHARRARVDRGHHPLRLVPLRMAVRARNRGGADARRAARRRHLLAVPSEFDLAIVAALLTILGYSVNDTVVVSDRIRENLRKYKKMELNELLNLSINETLSRTILTGATTLAACWRSTSSAAR